MASNHKYSCSVGCCICATKNSTSQFRPWFDHYNEDTYCRVFKLRTLSGRKGHVCNPCVLYIKRAIMTLDNPTPEQLENPPDNTKRLDCKLKGGIRPVIMDILPPDSLGTETSVVRHREPGFFARNMRFRPRYVFTGKPFVKMKSTYQLIPAGPWQDPREFMEEEDDAAKDLQFYRRVTLKEGVKTLKQKAEEERIREAIENARLFGKIRDSIPNKKKQQQNSLYCTRGKGKRPRIQASKKKSNSGVRLTQQPSSKTYGTRANLSRKKCSAEEDTGGDASFSSEENDYTESDYEITQEDDGSLPQAEILPAEPEDIIQGTKRSYSSSEENIPRKRLCFDDNPGQKEENGGYNSIQDCDRKPALPVVPRKKNRRVFRTPVKNLPPRSVSFMDCSYWQKFQLCCADVYMGEGRYAVIHPRINRHQCPVYAQQRARLERQQRARLERQQRARLERQQKNNSDEQTSTSVEHAKEVSSPVSSGDDELNDSRNNFSSSPLVEASLLVESFQFFGNRASDSKTSNF